MTMNKTQNKGDKGNLLATKYVFLFKASNKFYVCSYFSINILPHYLCKHTHLNIGYKKRIHVYTNESELSIIYEHGYVTTRSIQI